MEDKVLIIPTVDKPVKVAFEGEEISSEEAAEEFMWLINKNKLNIPIDTKWEDIQQCEKCHKFKRKVEFYSFKDGTKDCFCKNCMKDGIYDWEVDTFILKLRRYDVPYIEEEWNYMRARQAEKVCKNNAKYSTIFGKYLSRMNLFATKHLGFNNSATDWKGTEKLFEELYDSED